MRAAPAPAGYGFNGSARPGGRGQRRTAPPRAARRGGPAGRPLPVIRLPDVLFSPAELERLRAGVRITAGQRCAALEWLSLIEAGGLERAGAGHPALASCMLGRLLGYGAGDVERGPGRAGILLRGSRREPLACLDVSGTLAPDPSARRRGGDGRSPAERTWGRMEGLGLEYGISTNCRWFVLLARRRGLSRHYRFDFEGEGGDPKRLREFVGAFSRAGIESGHAGRPREGPGDAGADAALADEFYGLYSATRLMLIREFGASGVGRAEAAAAARALLGRLVFAFLARDSGLAGGRDFFADGVADVLGGRLGGRSKRVWSYMVDEMLPELDMGPGGGLFGAPLPPGAKIMDLRPEGFFGGLGATARGGSWEYKEGMWAAAGRHGGLNPIIRNLLAMSSYDFKGQVGVTVLGHIFERSISEADGPPGDAATRRKREGVFYTPAYVARHVCRSTIMPWLSRSGGAADAASLVDEYGGDAGALEARLRGIRILDPACGSGAFLIAAAETLLGIYGEIRARAGAGAGASRGTLDPDIAEASPLEAVRGSLHGIDTSPQSVEIARLSLFLATASPFERPPDLSKNIVVGDAVRNAAGPGWAGAFPHVMRGGGFDVIVGNPPYVRQEDLEDKESMALPRGSGLALPPGFEIPRKSDLSSYFYYHSIAGLADGGRLGFIASDGWLSHGYGLPLQRVMLDNCRIDALLRPAFNVFGDADVKTAVSLLARARPARGHRIAFAAIRDTRELDDWTRHVAARRPQRACGPGNWSSHFAGPSPRPAVPTVPLGLAGRVKGGIKTGRNKFFVLTRDAIKDYSIRARFRRPVLSDGIADGCLGRRRAEEHLLSVDLPPGRLAGVDGGPDVLRYIRDAESAPVVPKKGSSRAERRISDLASLRGRDPWYSLGLRDAPPAAYIGRFVDRRLRVYRNDGRFYARDNFAGFTPSRPDHADALLACIASPWFALHLEKNGHVAGGGALQVLIADLVTAPVPDLERMDGRDVERLGGAWNAYCEDMDRPALDDAVLGILGFTEAQRSRMAAQLATLVSYRAGGG